MKKTAILLALVIVLAATVAIFAACQEKYDLVYANWNFGTDAEPTVEREMVKAFEEANGVKIKLLSFPTGYDDGIIGSIARDEAPDVFMTSNIPFVLSNQYGMDITEMIASDPDWNSIPEVLRQEVEFKGGTYFIPFQMHMLGVFVNVDLLKDEGIELPKDGNYTYEWFKNAVTQITQHGDNIGLNKEETVFEWYPAAANKNLGYFTWDGEKYNLNTEEFKQGMAETKYFRDNHLTFGGMTDAMKAKFEGYKDDVDAWNKGKIAFRWGYTYEVPDMVKNSGFPDIRFIGIPSLSGEDARNLNFPTLVPDYVSIYKGTSNPELAYKFAKWMSFDPEGIAKRIELAKTGDTANTLPMTTDENIVEKFCDVYPIDGIETMYARLASAVFEPVKTVPGYTDSRWLAQTGLQNVTVAGELISRAKMEDYLNACWNGDQSYPAHAEDCDRVANQQLQNALNGYKDKY